MSPRNIDSRQSVSVPLVSVVIPAYNAENTIRRALESALEQDYERLEVIVADDCSTDSTREVAGRINNPRITLLASPVNRGAAAARNRAIRHASGVYIAFLDADDTWLPGKISAQVRMMEENPKASITTCDCLFFDGEGRPRETFFEKRAPRAGENAWQVLLSYNFVATPTVLARKTDVVELGGFSETLPIGEDQELWIRLAARGELLFSPGVLVHVYSQPAGLSKRYREQEAFLLLSMIGVQLREQRHRLGEDQVRSIWGQRLFDLAANLYHNKEYGRCAPLFWQSASCGFRRFKSAVNVARSVGCGIFRRDRNLSPGAWRDGMSRASLPGREQPAREGTGQLLRG
jgi:glycosyltransferase involved in cell wall biosynthesis